MRRELGLDTMKETSLSSHRMSATESSYAVSSPDSAPDPTSKGWGLGIGDWERDQNSLDPALSLINPISTELYMPNERVATKWSHA